MAIERTIEINTKTKGAEQGFDKLAEAIKELNETFGNFQTEAKQNLQNLEKSSKSTQAGVSKIAKGFKAVGLAIKAAGIGLLLDAFSTLKDLLSENQVIADIFSGTFEFFSIVVNDFVNFIINNTSGVVDFFKAIFENPKKSLKEFADAFKKNIQERFESYLDTLGFLASAVKKVFSGDFKGALEDVKKAGKESIDVFTGVNNSFDKGKEIIAKTTEAVTNYAKETFNSAKQNVELANAAELAAAKQSLLIEKYDIQAEQLRQIRDEERNSIQERREANDRLLEVLAEQEKALLSQADAQIKVAQIELAKNNSVKNQVALTEALANKQGVLAQIEGFRSEQKANDLALDREEIELTNSKLESESNLAIERQRFNAEQITNELERLEKLKEINDLEREQEQARLQDIIDNANAGTQAKVDAQIALDEFNEQSRQADLQLDKAVTDAKIKNAESVSGSIGALASIAGEGTAAGKALGVASATIDTYVGANKALAQGGFAGIAQAIAIIASGLANVKTILSTKVPKPKVGGISTGGGGGGGGAQVQAPSFNIVGATDTNQLADAISGQTQQPVQAFVVANDVTTAQSLENNIVEGATL